MAPVTLIVNDGKGDESKNGVIIRDLNFPRVRRFLNPFVTFFPAFKIIRKIHPVIVHFHDPELIPLGCLLALFGYRIIYDVHENVPEQILTKHWLPVWLRRPLSLCATAIEWLTRFFGFRYVIVLPSQTLRFPEQRCTLVQNYPILQLFKPAPSLDAVKEKGSYFIYTGAITEIRAIREIIAAFKLTPPKFPSFLLAGTFEHESLKKEITSTSTWETKVNYIGQVPQEKIARLVPHALAGLQVILPLPNHLRSNPNKLFEYMACGIPVIASNFPCYRAIIDENSCGLLVDPTDPRAIAKALHWIVDHPQEARSMGHNGCQAAKMKYNWDIESRKLIELYRQLLKREPK
nr:glycosyltransferase [Jonquetella anthropi]